MSCLVTLPGCSALFNQSAGELTFPAVIDFSTARCPELDRALRNEWARINPRPAHWGKPGPDGKPAGATTRELLDLIDKLELSEARKNGYGKIETSEYDRCRNGDERPTS